MPAVFVAAISSELKLSNRMREIAHETKQTLDTATWAQEQWEEQKHRRSKDIETGSFDIDGALSSSTLDQLCPPTSMLLQILIAEQGVFHSLGKTLCDQRRAVAIRRQGLGI